MKIDQKTQRKIDELRRLAALPRNPRAEAAFLKDLREPTSTRHNSRVRKLVGMFCRAMRRDANLEQLRADFRHVSLGDGD